jgi:hypothetical protein
MLEYLSILLLCGAEIVAKDDPTKENLGRTQEEQHLINSSMQWMKVKGFFEN